MGGIEHVPQFQGSVGVGSTHTKHKMIIKFLYLLYYAIFSVKARKYHFVYETYDSDFSIYFHLCLIFQRIEFWLWHLSGKELS